MRETDFNGAIDYINGKTVTVDGISGTIEVRGARPYRKIYHNADAKGRRTDRYQETRRKLHDDWSSDLTESDNLVEVMERLGVRAEAAFPGSSKTVILVPE
jgi:hypothetical protein